MTWIAIETYYKHGDYQLHVFYDDSSLKSFLFEKIHEYNIEEEIEEVGEDNCEPDILYLIDLLERHGNYRIEEQLGWGVREIRQI
jgi:hypothetical protein